MHYADWWNWFSFLWSGPEGKCWKVCFVFGSFRFTLTNHKQIRAWQQKSLIFYCEWSLSDRDQSELFCCLSFICLLLPRRPCTSLLVQIMFLLIRCVVGRLRCLVSLTQRMCDVRGHKFLNVVFFWSQEISLQLTENGSGYTKVCPLWAAVVLPFHCWISHHLFSLPAPHSGPQQSTSSVSPLTGDYFQYCIFRCDIF